MDYYTAYGLIIESFFELPELPSVERSTPDVVIDNKEVEKVPKSVKGQGIRRIQANPQECKVTYDSHGTFLVKNGNEISVSPDRNNGLKKKVIRHTLERQILGILLHQRGRLVLHASAVSINGKGAIFLGPSGVGKSTIATAIHTVGHSILEDDVVSVRFDSNEPIVDPGIPEQRLCQDTVDGLNLSEQKLDSLDLVSGKIYRKSDYEFDSVPLKRCYVVQKGNSLSMENLESRKNVLQLITNTYGQGLLTDIRSSVDHFQQCSVVSQNTPFRLIKRTDDITDVYKLVDQILDDLQ